MYICMYIKYTPKQHSSLFKLAQEPVRHSRSVLSRPQIHRNRGKWLRIFLKNGDIEHVFGTRNTLCSEGCVQPGAR